MNILSILIAPVYKTIGRRVTTNDIIKGFNIVGDFLDKTILKPNNINYPLSRIEFGNLIKLN